MRLPHFRVRMLMVVVGVVAFLLWGAMMGLRSYEYYRLSRYYDLQQDGWRRSDSSGNLPTAFRSECVEYFGQLTRKYRRAMWHPWMPVAPDPHAPGYDLWVEQEIRAKRMVPNPAAPGDHRAQPK